MKPRACSGLVPGSVLLVALSTLAMSCGHASPAGELPPPSPSRLLGVPAPSFRRPTLRGERFDTAAASGRVLLLDFFAGYCAPCRRSLPALQALHRRHQGGDLMIVGVSLDETPSAAQALVDRYALTFPVVHDAGSVLAGRFRVTELPASFVVDRQGRVVWAGGGDQPEGAARRAALATLGKTVSR